MRGDCIYQQVMIQMYLRGWDSKMLAEKTGISYQSIRRKLRGDSPLTLDEAMRIRDAMECILALDELFARPE